jgi:hypothetical protein
LARLDSIDFGLGFPAFAFVSRAHI